MTSAQEQKMVNEVKSIVAEFVLPRVQKFIDKCENGKARSTETYQDMKDIREFLKSL